MRAAVISGPREVRFEQAAMPVPSATEVRVRIEGCGICGSNLPVWMGRPWFDYPRPPGVPGHEPWGTVDAIGGDVQDLEPGDRVAFLSESAFADFAVADARAAVKLPAVLDGMPVPAEPLACVANVMARAKVQAGERVAVVGIGFLGAMIVSLAHGAGARVTAVSRRQCALEVARTAGAEQALTLERGMEAAQYGPFDCVVEAAGEQATLDVAGALVRERGRLIIAGYHQDGPRQIDMQSWNWRGLDVINAHERDRAVYVAGMRTAVDWLARGVVDPRPFFTHMFPLQDIDRALDAAASRPAGFLKALVTM